MITQEDLDDYIRNLEITKYMLWIMNKHHPNYTVDEKLIFLKGMIAMNEICRYCYDADDSCRCWDDS